MQHNSTLNDSNLHLPRIRITHFRFYEELNDHLAEELRKKSFAFKFKGNPTVKDSIQAMGVPHGEVDLILVNGEPVDFNYHLQGGEEISVYPVFETLDITPLNRLHPEPLREVKFVVDVNIGKLVSKLRLLGFDTYFRNDLDDDEIIQISRAEKRIILTRDKGILKQRAVTHGYFLRSDNPKLQVTEVVNRFQLQNLLNPFSRCTACNGALEEVGKENLLQLLPEDTLSYFNEFWQCTSCGKIYWKGSHFDHITAWMEDLNKAGNIAAADE